MAYSREKGWTLTEVAIASTVVGVMSIVGFSHYNNGIAKAQTEDGYELAQVLKKAVDDHYAANVQALPLAHFDDFGPDPTDYVTKATVQACDDPSDCDIYVRVEFSATNVQAAVAGKVIALVPTEPGGSYLSWSCKTNITGGLFNGQPVSNTEASALINHYCEVDTAFDYDEVV